MANDYCSPQAKAMRDLLTRKQAKDDPLLRHARDLIEGGFSIGDVASFLKIDESRLLPLVAAVKR